MKNERILQLDQILQHRRTPASMQLLCEHLECSEATVKRLIRDMRERFGAPIIHIRGSGYQYDPTQEFFLPALLFNTSELVALLSIKQLITSLHPNFLDKTLSPVQQKIDHLLAVAHAITTHAVDTDIDWFTAMDDLVSDAGDVGAGHLNTQEFSSGVFYRYASLNLKQLQVNLGLLADMKVRRNYRESQDCIGNRQACFASDGYRCSFGQTAEFCGT